MSDGTAAALTEITAAIVRAGGTVVVPDNASLLSTSTFRNMLSDGDTATTLSYGQAAEVSGLHIMETQTEHWVESVTGLGATGVEQMLATTPDHPAQGHPMIPMIQMGTATYGDDLDLLLDASSDEILILLGALASREYTPRQVAQRNVDFQVTRGLLGVSM